MESRWHNHAGDVVAKGVLIMSRLKACFTALNQAQRKALIPFVTAGDPQPEWTLDILHGLVEAGADILEIGVPFTDPMADGPVIQLADERALKHGINLHDILAIVRQFRETNQTTPVVLMGYLNPVEMFGYQAFATAAAAAGVDAVLTVDLPPEASAPLRTVLSEVAIDTVFLIAPTTSEKRIALIAEHASGYLYYVSLKGVTGAGNLDVAEVTAKLETIRKITQLPIAVGFGIKDASSAAAVAGIADGVVVGSALVNQIAEHQHDKARLLAEVKALTQSLKQAI
jgi:tryptophan synthase alpha chain